jgi:hypothetical protein
MTRKLPQTLDEHIAEAEEAERLGMTIDEFRKPKLDTVS